MADMAHMTAAPIGPSASELETAIALYRGALPPGRLRMFDIGALDVIGMSVQAAAYCGDTGFVMDGFGYGPVPEEAMVGALGELSETAHVDRAIDAAAVEIASYDALVQRLGPERVIDPRALCLPAGSDWSPEDRLAWVELRRHPDGARAMAPLDCVAFSPGQWVRRAGSGTRALFRPITCGLGAGTSLDQALSHAVLELLQRDGNCTTFRAMDQGVVVALDDVADPGLRALLARLSEAGVEPVAKLASTEFGLANLYVVGRGPDTGFPLVQTACGEAVHANAERALRKALLEFAAARSRKSFMHGSLAAIERISPPGYLEDYRASFDLEGEEPRALAEMRRWLGLDTAALTDLLADTVFAERGRVALSALPSLPDARVAAPAARMADLTARLAAAGIEIWYFDASAGCEGPVVVKALAPGLEGETMSYHRIGRRGAARLEARGSALVSREPGEGRARIRMTEAEEAAFGPAWFDCAAADAVVGRAYPLYREPSSHAVQLQAERAR